MERPKWCIAVRLLNDVGWRVLARAAVLGRVGEWRMLGRQEPRVNQIIARQCVLQTAILAMENEHGNA